MDLCISCNLYIVNGRKLGDTCGRKTCFQYNGSSAVYYLIMTNEVFDKVNYFQVQKLMPCHSDHCALTYSVNLVRAKKISSSTVKLTDAPKQYVWNDEAKSAFIANLDTFDVQNKFDEFTLELSAANSVSSCSENIAVLTDLMNSICDLSAIRKKTRNNKKPLNCKLWFDKECKEKRTELQKLGKMASHEPKDSLIREELYKNKKSFMKLQNQRNSCV